MSGYNDMTLSILETFCYIESFQSTENLTDEIKYKWVFTAQNNSYFNLTKQGLNDRGS